MVVESEGISDPFVMLLILKPDDVMENSEIIV